MEGAIYKAKAIERYLMWFGRFCGAASVFSLATKAFNIGLAEALAPLINAWRVIVDLTIGWLINFFHLPAIWGDLFVLSSITIFIFYRGALRLGVKPIRSGYANIRSIYVTFATKQFAERISNTEVYVSSPVTTLAMLAEVSEKPSEGRYTRWAKQSKRGRMLTRGEIAKLSELKQQDLVADTDQVLINVIMTTAIAVPVIFVALSIAAIFVLQIGPFVDLNIKYDPDFLGAGLKATLYVPLLIYFFGPLLLWTAFLITHFRMHSQPTHENPFFQFPKFIYDETVILAVSVAIFFLLNAGFSLF